MGSDAAPSKGFLRSSGISGGRICPAGLSKRPCRRAAVLFKSLFLSITWTHVALELGSGRTGKQCRERWEDHLNPSIKKGPWSEEEDRQIIAHHESFGTSWAEYAKILPGRTRNAIKNRWNNIKPRIEKHLLSKSRVDENGESPLIKDPDTNCYIIGDDVEAILTVVRASGQPRKRAKRAKRKASPCKRAKRAKRKASPFEADERKAKLKEDSGETPMSEAARRRREVLRIFALKPAQLRSELDVAGVEFDKKTKKADLQDLLMRHHGYTLDDVNNTKEACTKAGVPY